MAVLTFLLWIEVALGAVDQPPPSCSFETLALPPIDELRDHKVSPSGMLFVAGTQAVFVRSPWGWTKAFEIPDGDESITALGVLAGSDERILVASSHRLWSVVWSDEIWKIEGRSTWPRRVRHFQSTEIKLPEPIDIAEIKSVPDASQPLRGWLVGHGGGLSPLYLTGSELSVGAMVATVGSHSQARWYPASNNFSVVFSYAASTLLSLKPDGTEGERYDLSSAINNTAYYPLPNIRTVVVDAARSLIFVGTNYGVLVAQRDAASGKITTPFEKIDALGTVDILHLDFVLGRLIVVGRTKFGKQAGGRVLAWEADDLVAWEDASSLAHGIRFAGGADGPSPEGASAAVSIDSDLTWVSDNEDRLWEWSQSGWKVLRRADVKFGEADIDAMRDPLRRPLIIPDLIGDRLAICREAEPFWHRIAVTDTSGLADIVPNPEGIGVWVLSRLDPYNSHQLAFPQLVTPHGWMDTLDSGEGSGFSVTRWHHISADGVTHWPQSSQGGLLFPLGTKAMYAVGARWRMLEVDDPVGARALYDFTPGAESSTTAWLGLAMSDGLATVIRFDVSDAADKAIVEDTGVKCTGAGADTATLIPDTTGHVWLACSSNGDLRLDRIHSIDSSPDRTIHVGSFPDKATWLVQAAMDSYLVGARGTKRLGLAASSMADEIDTETSPLLGQIVKDSDRKADASPYNQWFAPLTYVVREVRPMQTEEGKTFGRYILLTSRDDQPAAEPGPPFRVDFQSQSQPVEEFGLKVPEAGRRSLVAWVEQSPAESALLAWGSPDGGIVGGRIEWILGDRSQSLDIAEDPVAAVRYIASEFSGESYSDRNWLAVATNSGVQFWRQPNQMFGRSIEIAVPTRLSIEHSDGQLEVYDLERQTPPAQLEWTATRATLTIVPDFDHWWLGMPRTEVRLGETEEWKPLQANGEWSFTLVPGREYRVEMRTWNSQGTETTDLRPMAVATAPTPPPVMQWGLAVLTLVALVLATAVIASVNLRRRILILLGNRLVLVSSACTYDASIHDDGNALRVRLLKNDESDFPLATANPPRTGDLGTWAVAVRAKLGLGSTALIELASSELFSRPWAASVTGDLASSEDLPVAGQIVPIPGRYTALGARSKKIVFAPIGCEEASNGPGPIYGVADHLAQLALLLRHRFVRVNDMKSMATVSDFLEALETADIVHVLAHATPTRMFMGGGDATAATIANAFAGRPLRCRLLVLAACEANRLEGTEGSFVAELVERGVTVLGATKPIDAAVGERFFSEFFKGMVPRSNSDGATLAESMRRAGRAVATLPREDVWRENLASLILYGNPTLRLRFTTGKNL